MKHLKFLAFLPLILTLAACSDVEQTVTDFYYNVRDMGIPANMDEVKGKPLADRLVEKGGCPIVEIVSDLATFSDFGSGAPAPETLVSQAQLSQQSTCAYGPKSVAIDVKLGVHATLGPAGQGAAAISYPYFVAILAPGGKILAKEVFSAPINFISGEDQHVENLRQIIPIYNQENGASHKVVIGFQLTQNQLAYNRAVIEERKRQAAAMELQDRAKYSLQPTADPPVYDPSLPALPPNSTDSGPIILAPQDDKDKLNQ